MADTFAMAELLKGDYRKAFEQIALYGNMSFGNEQFVDDRMMNIYDMLIEAQENGKPVEKIIGVDLEKFCEEYFRAESKGIWVKEFLKRGFYIAVLTLVFTVIDYLLEGEGVAIQNAGINLRPILIGISVGCVLMAFGKLVQRKLMFQNSKIKPVVYYIIWGVLFLGGIVFLLTFTQEIDASVNALLVISVTGGYCILYLIVTLLLRYQRHGSFRNPDKPDKAEAAERKEFQKELTLQSDMISSARGMAKRYNKLKEKNVKKGKPEYTMHEFIKLIKKETNFGTGFKILYVGVPIVCVLAATLYMAISEGLMAAGVVFAVLTIVMAFGGHFYWGICKEVMTAQRAVIEDCEERGVHILEYVEELEQSLG